MRSETRCEEIDPNSHSWYSKRNTDCKYFVFVDSSSWSQENFKWILCRIIDSKSRLFSAVITTKGNFPDTSKNNEPHAVFVLFSCSFKLNRQKKRKNNKNRNSQGTFKVHLFSGAPLGVGAVGISSKHDRKRTLRAVFHVREKTSPVSPSCNEPNATANRNCICEEFYSFGNDRNNTFCGNHDPLLGEAWTTAASRSSFPATITQDVQDLPGFLGACHISEALDGIGIIWIVALPTFSWRV